MRLCPIEDDEIETPEQTDQKNLEVVLDGSVELVLDDDEQR